MIAALQAAPALAPEWWAIAVGALGLAFVVVMAVAYSRASRRGLFASTREIVRAAEEMAEGRVDRPATLAGDDPLAPAAAALARLAGASRAHTLDVERRLRLLEEILASARTTALLVTDPGGDIRFSSPGAEHLFNWKSGEAQGQRIELLFEDAADFDSLLPKLSRRSIRDSTIRQEARLRRREGASFGAEILVGAFGSLPGGGEGLLFEIRDLSGEDALRAELRDSEERHRTLTETVPLGVFVVQHGRMVFANPALSEILRTQQGLLGSEFRDHLAAEDLLDVLDRVRRAETGEDPRFEMDCRFRPAGNRWPIEVSLSASRIVYGGKPAVIGCVRETGPDRGLLRQIRVSETKLDAALGASEEGVLLLSDAPGGGSVTLANRRFEEMLGFGPRSLAGLSREELAETLAARFTDHEGARAFLRRLAEPGPAQSLPHRAFETSNDPARTMEFSSRAAHDRDGRLIGRLISARDVTVHKESERRLSKEAEDLARTRDLLEHANLDLATVNQELSRRSSEVEKANQELRTLDEMKSNLLANVSHELQTPLVSIKGYTDMILKGRLGAITEEQRKGLEVSLRNIDRLIGMINNLLSFSRLEREMSGMTIAAFPLPELIEESIDLVREPALQRRIALTSRYQTDDLEIKADREKIGQVFTNLLSNAVKYNREGGQVQIEVRKGRKGYLLVEVKDTGIGIPRESLDKIFDRFFRAQGEAPATAPGTGIGLSIVRDVLRMHGCIVKVDSTLGEGTVFTFTLPLASRSEDEEAPASQPTGLTARPAPGGPAPGSVEVKSALPGGMSQSPAPHRQT